MRLVRLTIATLLLTAALSACDRQTEVAAPPRATDKAPSPTQKSLIAVPINANTASLKQALERAVPRTLWTIDQRERACIQPQRVKVFGKKVKVRIAVTVYLTPKPVPQPTVPRLPRFTLPGIPHHVTPKPNGNWGVK